MKELRCRDVGVNCDFVARGQSEDEVMKAAAEHGRTAHKMTEIPEDLMAKMLSLVREVDKA